MGYLTNKRLKSLVCEGIVLSFRGKEKQGIGLITKMIITKLKRNGGKNGQR